MRQLHSLTIILKISLERILFLPPERIQFSQLHEIVPKSRSEIHYMKICKVRIWIQKEQVRSGNNWTVDVTKGLFLPYKRVSYNSFCDYHIWLTGKKKKKSYFEKYFDVLEDNFTLQLKKMKASSSYFYINKCSN